MMSASEVGELMHVIGLIYQGYQVQFPRGHHLLVEVMLEDQQTSHGPLLLQVQEHW